LPVSIPDGLSAFIGHLLSAAKRRINIQCLKVNVGWLTQHKGSSKKNQAPLQQVKLENPTRSRNRQVHSLSILSEIARTLIELITKWDIFYFLDLARNIQNMDTM
jgi:hypothetical protein